MALDEVKARLGRGVDETERALDRVATLRGDLRDVFALGRAVGHDSKHVDLATGLTRLAAALRETDRVIRLLRSAADEAKDYLVAIG